jgi:hypothetical protein
VLTARIWALTLPPREAVLRIAEAADRLPEPDEELERLIVLTAMGHEDLKLPVSVTLIGGAASRAYPVSPPSRQSATRSGSTRMDATFCLAHSSRLGCQALRPSTPRLRATTGCPAVSRGTAPLNAR